MEPRSRQEIMGRQKLPSLRSVVPDLSFDAKTGSIFTTQDQETQFSTNSVHTLLGQQTRHSDQNDAAHPSFKFFGPNLPVIRSPKFHHPNRRISEHHQKLPRLADLLDSDHIEDIYRSHRDQALPPTSSTKLQPLTQHQHTSLPLKPPAPEPTPGPGTPTNASATSLSTPTLGIQTNASATNQSSSTLGTQSVSATSQSTLGTQSQSTLGTQSQSSLATQSNALAPSQCIPTPGVMQTNASTTSHSDGVAPTRGRRTYECPHCEKVCDRKSNITQHIRVHTGERPFPCDLCNKAFSAKSTLIVHMRAHTGSRPFVCDVCGLGFRQGSHLRRHSKTHAE